MLGETNSKLVQKDHFFSRKERNKLDENSPVSYTHLTLPTIYSV